MIMKKEQAKKRVFKGVNLDSLAVGEKSMVTKMNYVEGIKMQLYIKRDTGLYCNLYLLLFTLCLSVNNSDFYTFLLSFNELCDFEFFVINQVVYHYHCVYDIRDVNQSNNGIYQRCETH